MSKRRQILTRDERRAIHFVQESFPMLYHTIFGEIMSLIPPDGHEQGLHAIAAICEEVGKELIYAGTLCSVPTDA